MVDRKQVKRNIKRLQRVKTWQLVILLILMGFVSATFLRLNNIGMLQRRAAVLEADQTGDDNKTKDRLTELQHFVSAHMNTDVGKGVYLEYSYNRAYQAALNTASGESNPNGNIYKKVQEVCMPKYKSWSYSYVMCVADELDKYPSSGNLTSQISVNQALYVHDFASPAWSPDFAGWSLIICVVILIMILARITSVAILRVILHRRYSSI